MHIMLQIVNTPTTLAMPRPHRKWYNCYAKTYFINSVVNKCKIIQIIHFKRCPN